VSRRAAATLATVVAAFALVGRIDLQEPHAWKR
jgi:hypothetical protein